MSAVGESIIKEKRYAFYATAYIHIHSILLSYQAKSPTIIHKTNDLENKMCGSFQFSGASTYLSSGVPTTPLFSSSS